jgi:hypothetical protein
MPTPIVFDGTDIDPIAEPHAGKRTPTSRVFYATDRTPRQNPKYPSMTYSDDRGFGLRLGEPLTELHQEDVVFLENHPGVTLINVAAAERGLVRTDGKPIWMFPKDYPERARAAALNLYRSDRAAAGDAAPARDDPPGDE